MCVKGINGMACVVGEAGDSNGGKGYYELEGKIGKLYLYICN